jgi:putative transposase
LGQIPNGEGCGEVHLLLDHDGLLPGFAIITAGKASDIRTAHKFSFPKGSMVVFDRGYCDYDWFAGFASKGVHFVTRLTDLPARFDRK